MDANNQQEKKNKKGFFAWLSWLARGGQRGSGVSGGRVAANAVPKTVSMPSVSTLSGVARGSGGLLSRIVTALRLPSVLATRAGVMGLILGGVTIATGMAAMSGFMNSPSKSSYNPGLFNNSYYDSLVSQAEKDKLSRGEEAASGSSLDMLQQQYESDQAAGEEAAAEAESAAAEAAPAAKKAAPAAPAAKMSAAAAAGGKSFGSSGFNFGGGGGSSASGLSGGGKAASAGTGGLSGGGASRGAGYGGSTRGSSLSRNAYRQAKSGKKSMSSAGGMMGKQAAASMFYDGGGTVGGEVAGVNGGVSGAGSPEGAGAGVSDSGTDSIEPPSPSAPEASGGGGGGSGDEEATESETELTDDITPWKDLSAAAMAVAAVGALLAAAIFGLGKLRTAAAGNPPLAAILLGVQLALLAMVLAAAVLLAMIGVKLLKDWGQQKEGLVTILGGVIVAALGAVAMAMGNKGFGAAAKAAGAAAGATGATVASGIIGSIAGIGGGIAAVLGVGGVDGVESLVSGNDQVQNPDNYSDEAKEDAGNFNTFIQGGQS